MIVTWQNQQNECAPSENSDQPGQPGHPPRLIWVFAGHTVTLLVVSCCSSYDDGTVVDDKENNHSNNNADDDDKDDGVGGGNDVDDDKEMRTDSLTVWLKRSSSLHLHGILIYPMYYVDTGIYDDGDNVVDNDIILMIHVLLESWQVCCQYLGHCWV